MCFLAKVCRGQNEPNKAAIESGVRFMGANGLKFVTLTSLNERLLEKHTAHAWEVARSESLHFRVGPQRFH